MYTSLHFTAVFTKLFKEWYDILVLVLWECINSFLYYWPLLISRGRLENIVHNRDNKVRWCVIFSTIISIRSFFSRGFDYKVFIWLRGHFIHWEGRSSSNGLEYVLQHDIDIFTTVTSHVMDILLWIKSNFGLFIFVKVVTGSQPQGSFDFGSLES